MYTNVDILYIYICMYILSSPYSLTWHIHCSCITPHLTYLYNHCTLWSHFSAHLIWWMGCGPIPSQIDPSWRVEPTVMWVKFHFSRVGFFSRSIPGFEDLILSSCIQSQEKRPNLQELFLVEFCLHPMWLGAEVQWCSKEKIDQWKLQLAYLSDYDLRFTLTKNKQAIAFLISVFLLLSDFFWFVSGEVAISFDERWSQRTGI